MPRSASSTVQHVAPRELARRTGRRRPNRLRRVDAHSVGGRRRRGAGAGVSLSRGGRGRFKARRRVGEFRRRCQTAGHARGGMLTMAKTARRPHPATRRRTRRRAARERGRRGGRAPRARRSGGGRDAPKRRVRAGRAGAHHLTRARVQLTEASGGGGRQVSRGEKRAARPPFDELCSRFGWVVCCARPPARPAGIL